MKKTSGITLITLVITIVIMIIILGVTLDLGIDNLKIKNLNNMYADLKSLRDNISTYYNKYGTIPLKEKFTGSYEFQVVQNPNDDPEGYYVIDINKLENILLTRNLTWTENDVYIINTKTHTIYYPEGVTLDGEKFYRLPGEYSKIEQTVFNSNDVTENPEVFYGGEVTNYTCTNSAGVNAWKIFYADSSNIYLIADDYIHYDYAPQSANYTLYKNSDYKLSFDNVYKDYTGGANITDSRIKKWISYINGNGSNINTNIRAVAFMLDVDIWSAKFGNSTYAEYAIGGPTLDMFVASYNQTHSDKTIEYTHNSTGYQVKWSTDSSYNTYISGLNTSESLYVISDTSKAYAMWLAAPSANSTDIVWCM